MVFTSCYRGPATEDPRETSATAVVPWGVALLPGKSSEQSGIGYVTHRRECCGIGVHSEFLIPNVHGVHTLYFDFTVPVTGRRVTIAFADGQTVSTASMLQGPQVVRLELPRRAVDNTGSAHVLLYVTTTPPDRISVSDGPTVLGFYGVTTDRDINPASEFLKTVIEAK